MKKIVFGIALILFGFCLAYISAQAQWGKEIFMQVISLLSILAGLFFSILGFIAPEK